MGTTAERNNDFLLELYNQTEGDTDRQVSMHDIGAAIGMEKADASTLAEDLIMDMLVELKTLSGGIGITAKGLEKLQQLGMVRSSATTAYRLSREKVATADDLDAIHTIIKEIQLSIPQADSEFENLEELIIDLKTLEVQLLSPRPKTSVVREILRSLYDCMNRQKPIPVAEQISVILSE